MKLSGASATFRVAEDRSFAYWFPAKTYGWGWGLPRTWEGWLVFVLYLALLLLAQRLFPPDQDPLRYTGCALLLSIALILICLAKGEPPSWRWGSSAAALGKVGAALGKVGNSILL